MNVSVCLAFSVFCVLRVGRSKKSSSPVRGVVLQTPPYMRHLYIHTFACVGLCKHCPTLSCGLAHTGVGTNIVPPLALTTIVSRGMVRVVHGLYAVFFGRPDIAPEVLGRSYTKACGE